MQTQERRDEKTLQIFTALVLFVGVVGLGGLLLLLVGRVVDIDEGLATVLFWVLALGAGTLAVAYLRRRGR